jgi:glutaredoxin-like protein NrdH
MTGTKKIKMFTLSTCSHCKAAKKFMTDNKIDHEFTDVDLLSGSARQAALEEVRKLNPGCSFPTIIIGSDVIIGFQPDEIKKALGI